MFKGVRKVVTWLGVAVGVLSLVMLVKHGTEIGWAAPLQLVLDYYEALKRVFFGWAEPYLRDVLSYLSRWLGWDLHLYPHWMDVFVLMWLYFGAGVRADWYAGDRGFAVFDLIWGGIIAVAAGVGSGTVALEDAASNMLMAAFPVAGIVVYQFGDIAWNSTFSRASGVSWWQDFSYRAVTTLSLAAVGGFALLLGTQADRLPFVRTLASPGLVLLGVLVFALALYWMWVGLGEARRDRETDESLWRAFLRRTNTHYGLLVLTTIVGAILFIVLNGGLKLVGL